MPETFVLGRWLRANQYGVNVLLGVHGMCALLVADMFLILASCLSFGTLSMEQAA